MEVPAIMMGANPGHGLGTTPHFPDELHFVEFPWTHGSEDHGENGKGAGGGFRPDPGQNRLGEPFWGRSTVTGPQRAVNRPSGKCDPPQCIGHERATRVTCLLKGWTVHAGRQG